MASSGTYAETLSNADILAEAFERAGRSPQSIESEHIESALRSMRLMFADWENEKRLTFQLEQLSRTVTAGESSFSLASGIVDVTTVMIRRDGIDIPMYPISRDDYANLPDKDLRGRPSRYWIERLNTPVMHYWAAAENSTDVIYYYAVRSFEDVGTLAQNPDAPRRWWEPICSGLAARLAEKYAPERVARLETRAAMSLRRAQDADREDAPVIIRPHFGARIRRRRR